MSQSKSRINVGAINQQIEVALPKYFPKKSFDVDGKTMTTPQVVAALEKEDSLNNAAVEAHAAWQAAAAAARTQTVANDVVRSALKSAVTQALGARNPALQQFGFAARARQPRSSEVNAAAAKKAAATRLARGTTSRKARLAIHGVVTPSAEAGSSPSAGNASGAAIAVPSATTQK
jgi:hypothetical protein